MTAPGDDLRVVAYSPTATHRISSGSDRVQNVALLKSRNSRAHAPVSAIAERNPARSAHTRRPNDSAQRTATSQTSFETRMLLPHTSHAVASTLNGICHTTLAH